MSSPKNLDPALTANPAGPDQLKKTKPRRSPGSAAKLTVGIVDAIAAELAKGRTKRQAAALHGSNAAQLDMWISRAREAVEENKATRVQVYLLTEVERAQALFETSLLDKYDAASASKTNGDWRAIRWRLQTSAPKDFSVAPQAPAQVEGQGGVFETITPQEATARLAEKIRLFLDSSESEPQPVSEPEPVAPQSTEAASE